MKRRRAAAKAMWPRTVRFVVLTGQHTGRSASDKFVVRDAETENQVWWDNNKADDARRISMRSMPT